MSVIARRCLRLFIYFFIIFFYLETFFTYINSPVLKVFSSTVVFLITDFFLRKIFKEPYVTKVEQRDNGLLKLSIFFILGLLFSLMLLIPRFFLGNMNINRIFLGFSIGFSISLFLLFLLIKLVRKGESYFILYGETLISKFGFIFLALTIGLYYLGILLVSLVSFFAPSLDLLFSTGIFSWSSFFFFSFSFIQLLLFEILYHKRICIGIKTKINIE